MTRPKHPPIAYVEWIDTGTVGEAVWQDREQVLKDAREVLQPIAAAGFLLADEPRGLILALLYNDRGDHVGMPVAIPRVNVKKLVIVRPGKGFVRE